MCGIAGFWDFAATMGYEDMSSVAQEMADSLYHRGPDDGGVWVDQRAGVALSHRRLSIIDLSSAGHQPMLSRNNGLVITYNGEVYNASEIRSELIKNGVQFHGSSDTEVVLEACSAWGVEQAVNKFVGMFSFALFDIQRKCIKLVRDRLGVKPLYWTKQSNQFMFSSEIKALYKHPSFNHEVDIRSLQSYMQYGYVPSPNSIIKNVYKLEPGSILTLDSSGSLDVSSYWNAADKALCGMQDIYSSENDAYNNIEYLLEDAVKIRMISDVPLGAFLSGGIDSSLIVALMQKNSSDKIRTYSIGFGESGYNEAVYAAKVAGHLQTDHCELYVTDEEARDVIPLLPDQYDEPFADSSQIPTYLVSKLASNNVKVILSGDGGDELFGGYNRHILASKIERIYSYLPLVLRVAFAASVTRIPLRFWNAIGSGYSMLTASDLGTRQLGDKLHKLSSIMEYKNGKDAYFHLASVWPDNNVVLADNEYADSLACAWPSRGSLSERMMIVDAETYLPDDILTKVDRASMAVSLEARAPFMDYRLYECAWRLPHSMKVGGNKGKLVLRQMLRKYIPDALIDRPKMGFGIPLDTWLRGPLREWAEELLDVSRINSEGYLDSSSVKRLWDDHISGAFNRQHQLWAVLMFQAWLDRSR